MDGMETLKEALDRYREYLAQHRMMRDINDRAIAADLNVINEIKRSMYLLEEAEKAREL